MLESQEINSHFSPIIGLLDIYLMPRMGATGVWAWNPRDNRTDNALVSLHYGDEHEQLINLAVKEGRARHIGRRLKKDGTIFWGSILITALHDDDGEVIGFTKLTSEINDNERPQG